MGKTRKSRAKQAEAVIEQQVEPQFSPGESIPPEVLDEPEITHVERLEQPKGLRPVPTGFKGNEGWRDVGIRLSQSLNKNVVAIQFAEDRRPSRDGINPEIARLQERGFSYWPERHQWERLDREDPSGNYQDAKEFVKTLVDERREVPIAELHR